MNSNGFACPLASASRRAHHRRAQRLVELPGATTWRRAGAQPPHPTNRPYQPPHPIKAPRGTQPTHPHNAPKAKPTRQDKLNVTDCIPRHIFSLGPVYMRLVGLVLDVCSCIIPCCFFVACTSGPVAYLYTTLCITQACTSTAV